MNSDLIAKRREQMFPKLSAAQIARLEAHGQRRNIRAGEDLTEPGKRPRYIFVVLSGRLLALLPNPEGEEAVYAFTPGDFTGEISALRGSAGYVRIQAIENGTVIAVDAETLRQMLQTDAELSELFMRAFILRRMGLMSEGSADVMLLGSNHSADTLRLREFLSRNACPYRDIDIESDPGVREILERFHVGPEDMPVVICHGTQVLRNPSNRLIADRLQINPQVDDDKAHDLLIVGAGPAGLAAAVYAASEGLDVRLIDTMAPGGQAGSSSKIENYLGFPTGISGQALAGRALTQAQKFGANLSVACEACRLHCDTRPYGIELADGSVLRAHAVLIATGARYRTLEVDDLARYAGAGIYYAATYLEARLCQDEQVVVVGGGNSAGQAAVFLAGLCQHVHMLVRSAGLAETMSNYLVRRIEESPNVTLHARTELIAVDGEEQLERIAWRTGSEPQEQWRDIRHVFLMIGAQPNTQWLSDCVALDARGFVKTGSDLGPDELAAAGWPLERRPYMLETSLPGVFAAGDVRVGSIKRIASVVGEGSICVQFVHRTLRDLAAAAPGSA
ncbi:MAG: pyridine nucleotide-disulfide oxidoreductase [Proteobacteria bacterium]|nr:MAG: pyridine nucleotide-disulfide oxidoreductase [Pseudomonadota bacterium]